MKAVPVGAVPVPGGQVAASRRPLAKWRRRSTECDARAPRSRARLASSAIVLAVLTSAVAVTTAHAQGDSIPPPRVGGYLQVRATYVTSTRWSFTINRARFSLDGPLPNRFTYRLLVETESGATAATQGIVSLREAILRWSYGAWAIQGGQFKAPFSREYLIPVPQLELADFSAVVSALAPQYEIGLMGEYAIPLVTAQAGAFNGEGINIGANRDSTVLGVARLSVRPIAQVTIAGNVARYSADSTRYGGDVTLEQSGVLVRAEAIGQRKTGRPRDDLGWYVLGGVRVLPWLQLLAKQEDFQRPSLGQARRIRATVGGLNVELPGGRTRFLANFVSRRTGFPQQKRNSVILQTQVRY